MVEFKVVDEEGRPKAVEVTAFGGGFIKAPALKRGRGRRGKKEKKEETATEEKKEDTATEEKKEETEEVVEEAKKEETEEDN